MALRLTFFFQTVFCMMCTLTPACCDSSGMYNEKIVTYIDVSSQLVNVKNTITVISKLFYPVNCYIFTIDPLWKDHLSYIEAHDSKGRPLSVNRLDIENSLLQFNITFQNYISLGESNTISVYSTYTHYLKSFPKRVKQSEQHLVLFSFNVYFYSESLTKAQETFVNVGSNKLLSVNGEHNYSATYNDNGYLLKYGPYFDMHTFSEHLSIIHYNNKSPFLSVEELRRYILLSHWGYANIWEKVLLVHSGPKFIGPYERPTGEDPAQDTRIESYTTILPKNAFNIYIKDDIGLLWNYDIHYDQDMHNILVTIRPRFIMYGGWKTRYEIGYTVAISNHLRYSENSYFNKEFYFNFPSIDIVFPHMVINKAQINIILPEGAIFHYISMYPYETENNISDIDVQKYCYYFDISCRKLISIKRYNMVEKHRFNFLLTYEYPQLFLLVKPLATSVYLLLFFIACILISRLKSHSPSFSQPITREPTDKTVYSVPNKGHATVVKKKKNRRC